MKPSGKLLRLREATSTNVGTTASMIVTEELITRVNKPMWMRYR